jgi:hypothetical protein
LNSQLHQALHRDIPVSIEYFQDGWLETVELRIKRINLLQMNLEGEITNSTRTMTLSLLDITKILTTDNRTSIE